ncbi:preprotein translocase subunit YajC [Veillonella magna]|jgi:preprotein translocase subunit YajC|uniref:Preprotein translocase subunit YajC n=1 Tax=Veillonella magna TaxID=464322 RepID=A0ABS2GEM1_9FIRM|nr:preprotein translocase subunit YajC [Veillonella magna]MBD8976271.1 preprotein translocase subunit YajC [Veillonella magna]MBM6823798.1 preprotein translocase subunit YajC [Veillonella magna]MBM6912277.1 preprotein translocase subunit YajC [Veillonella magna]
MEDLNQLFQAGWPILLMVVIFYFLLYRPQKKQQKERNNLLNSLKKGQKVVTIGGIYGTINTLHEDSLTLQIAEKVEIKVARSSVARVLGKDDK